MMWFGMAGVDLGFDSADSAPRWVYCSQLNFLHLRLIRHPSPRAPIVPIVVNKKFSDVKETINVDL